MKPSGMWIMAVGFGLNALLLLAAALGSFLTMAISLLLKTIGDYSFLRSVLKKQDRLDLLRYVVWFEAYFIFYVLLLPFVVFFGGHVVWKGRTY